MHARQSQRGVALLTAIILVAMTTIIAAAIVFKTAMTARRSASTLAFDEAAQLAGGAEGYAADILAKDSTPNEDRPDDDWARPFGPLEVAPGVRLQAQMVDLDGRFNLNSLVDDQGKKSPQAYLIFQRLLSNLKLDPNLADEVLDWIDADFQAEPYGAEDSAYSSQSPPYRTPNAAITNVSELLAMKDFGPENYAKLKDYVAALPRPAAKNATPINLCTAPAELVDAVLGAAIAYTLTPANLVAQRKGQCFPTKQDVSTLNQTEFAAIEAQIGISNKSRYFRLTSIIGIGTSQFALYSFLQRTNSTPGGPSQTLVLSRRYTE